MAEQKAEVTYYADVPEENLRIVSQNPIPKNADGEKMLYAAYSAYKSGQKLPNGFFVGEIDLKRYDDKSRTFDISSSKSNQPMKPNPYMPMERTSGTGYGDIPEERDTRSLFNPLSMFTERQDKPVYKEPTDIISGLAPGLAPNLQEHATSPAAMATAMATPLIPATLAGMVTLGGIAGTMDYMTNPEATVGSAVGTGVMTAGISLGLLKAGELVKSWLTKSVPNVTPQVEKAITEVDQLLANPQSLTMDNIRSTVNTLNKSLSNFTSKEVSTKYDQIKTFVNSYYPPGVSKTVDSLITRIQDSKNLLLSNHGSDLQTTKVLQDQYLNNVRSLSDTLIKSFPKKLPQGAGQISIEEAVLQDPQFRGAMAQTFKLPPTATTKDIMKYVKDNNINIGDYVTPQDVNAGLQIIHQTAQSAQAARQSFANAQTDFRAIGFKQFVDSEKSLLQQSAQAQALQDALRQGIDPKTKVFDMSLFQKALESNMQKASGKVKTLSESLDGSFNQVLSSIQQQMDSGVKISQLTNPKRTLLNPTGSKSKSISQTAIELMTSFGR